MNNKSLMRQPSKLVSHNELRHLIGKFLDDTSNHPLNWESITTKDGLAHNWIYDLFLDSKGQIWVGTWGGGISVYDGNKWKTFTKRHGLSSNEVNCIREDKQGRIWIATDGGMNLFSGDRFVEAGLFMKSILNITFDVNGNLWAGCWRALSSGGGLFKYDGEKWEGFSTRSGLPGLEILKVFEDSRQRIWVGTYEQGRGAGVGCFDGKKWKVYNRNDGLINDTVYSMFEDPGGNMWFGTIGGISIFNGKTWYKMTTMDGLVDDRVYCMFIDSSKKMWFGTEGGLSRYDGKNWVSYTKKDGLVENLIRAILEDRDGNLWFGTYPYAKGKGGISVGRYKRKSMSIGEKLVRYLPGSLKQGLLDSSKEH